MNSFMLMVDAGYVYAAGGMLIYNTTARHELRLNPAALRDVLDRFGRDQSGARMLRMYWYDGAPDRSPTPEHRLIASQQGIQLRLGRLTPKGGQKGVDSLIYRDLFTLSRTGRLSDVFLLAGDEDLLEGVHAAQDQGVRVSLIGIEPSISNQSDSLRDAADAIYVLQREELEKVLIRRRAPEGAAASGASTRKLHHLEQEYARGGVAEPMSPADRDAIETGARQVAADFTADASSEEREAMYSELRKATDPNRRQLPKRADGWLLRSLSDQLDRWLTEAERILARKLFWEHIALFSEQVGNAAEKPETAEPK